jgi:hypothetical protein
MAPAGKSVVQVWYTSDYDYWATLHLDERAYAEEKQRVGEQTVAELERRWPGFARQVEVVDVATPVTFERYTGNWQGSPDGCASPSGTWAPSSRSGCRAWAAFTWRGSGRSRSRASQARPRAGGTRSSCSATTIAGGSRRWRRRPWGRDHPRVP